MILIKVHGVAYFLQQNKKTVLPDDIHKWEMMKSLALLLRFFLPFDNSAVGGIPAIILRNNIKYDELI